jgi:pyruvate formate lyase activating enzyme
MISGLQKMTLLDFPGKVACTVFLQGCNFRCPFCHNSGLLEGNEPDLMTAEELLDFLKKRQGILDGVCITGGEPTLQPGLPDLLKAIKALGYAVKLDTNGSRPEIMKQLVADGLVDYVAMDIKNSPQRYGETVGVPKLHLEGIEESIRFLLSGAVDYELRTTVVAQLHDSASMAQMGAWLQHLVPGQKVRRLFLQCYVDRDSVLSAGLSAPQKEDLEAYAQILAPFADFVKIRGVD